MNNREKIASYFLLNSGGGAPNNSYVQGVLDVSSDSPSQPKIDALNTFFNSINSLMGLAEMIKIYSLNDATLIDFQLYNFKNPSLNKSIPVSSPSYGTEGYESNGTTSYVNDNIKVNRRAGIESNFTSLCFVVGEVDMTGLSNKAIYGSQVDASQYVIARITNATLASFWGYSTALTLALSGTSHLYGNVSTSTNKSKGLLDSTYTAGMAPVAPSLSYDIFSCAWNYGGSPFQFNEQTPIGIRFEGYQLTPEQIEIFRLACVQYKNDVFF